MLSRHWTRAHSPSASLFPLTHVCTAITASTRPVRRTDRLTLATLASSSRPTSVQNPHSLSTSAANRTNLVSRHLSSPTSYAATDNMASLPISEKGYDNHAPSRYTARKVAAANTLEHRIYLEKDGVPVSPFHDVALFANEQQTILNMVVEVPRWTNAKMEVCPRSLMPSALFAAEY